MSVDREPKNFENALAEILGPGSDEESAADRYRRLDALIKNQVAEFNALESDSRYTALAERLSPILEAAQHLQPLNDYAARIAMIGEAASRIPNFGEMIQSSALTMQNRLSPGRPRVPAELRAKPVGISLSKVTRDQLETLSALTDKTRSDIVAEAVALWADILIARGPQRARTYTYADALAEMNLGPLTSALQGVPVEPLSSEDAGRATTIANQALGAWITPERTPEEIATAMRTLYAGAVAAVRANR